MTWFRKKVAPTNNDLLVLQSDCFVGMCAKVAAEKYDAAACGAEFMKRGLALLTGLPLEIASAHVTEMLAMHDQKIAAALMERADTNKRN